MGTGTGKIILAIDPGLTGALVWMQNGVVLRIEDMPVMAKLTGKGNQVNASQLAHLVYSIRPGIAYVERVHAMPKQGVSSVFQFGHGVGIIHGVLAALTTSMQLVTPNAWKKHCGLLKKPKDAARSLAITTHPYIADQLNLKKHGGRADAICIGDYATVMEAKRKQ